MKKIVTFIALVVISLGLNAQDKAHVNWVSFEEAVELSEKKPKKILVDVYTDWCGWCKRMDKDTYMNKEIVSYINKNYYAVKLNAEMKDTVHFRNVIFVSQPGGRRATHELAISLLDSKMSYPTTVFLDENFNMLTRAPGYLDAKKIEPILHFFNENKHLELPYEDFTKDFESSLKPLNK
jgi:thioredoxin-related protein